MIYVLAALVVGFYAQLVVNFWRAVRKFGKWNETIGREHHMFAMDGVSLFAALMVIYWAAHDWFGFSLPLFQKAPAASWECMFMAVSCAVASLAIGYFNGRERFTNATHAGISEAALRFLATRQIITAAEVAQGMPNGRVIDITAREGGCKPEPQKFPSPSHHPLAGVDPTVVSPAAIELIRAIDSKQVGCFRIREI